MPRFEPFTGIRYAAGPDQLTPLVAPPYDVIDDEDRAALAARSPHNIVHIDVPLDRDGPGRYAAAAALLQQWLSDRTLAVDAEPVYYGYRMSWIDELGAAVGTTGVIGALEVVPTGEGDVLPHEQTTPKAKTDRLDLTRATGTNLSAVWGLSMAEGLTAAVAGQGRLVADVVDDDGVHHELTVIDDASAIAAIRAIAESAPVVIADGHHRYEVARTYRAERAAAAEGPSAADLTMALLVELTPPELHVLAIHRLLSGVPEGYDLLAALGPHFHAETLGPVSAATAAEMVDRGGLCLVDRAGHGMLLQPKEGAFDDLPDLDSARLDHALADVPHEIAYQHGIGHVIDALTGGRAQYGVLLRPVTVPVIQAMADRRQLMPPKSTFFSPKPRTGLVIRPLN